MAVKHNHITRDIKDEGICPACDVFHYNQARDLDPQQARARIEKHILAYPEYLDRDRDILLLRILDLLERKP